MNDQQQHRQKDGSGFNFLYLVAKGYSTTVTVFLRQGFGSEALGWPGLIAFFVLILVAADTRSAGMWMYFWVWLVTLAGQRVQTFKRRKAGAVIHSQYPGWPEVTARLFRVRKENWAKTLEIPLVFGAGAFFVLALSEIVGVFLFTGAIALALVRVIDYQANVMNLRRMQDAMIEQQVMTEYWREGRDDF